MNNHHRQYAPMEGREIERVQILEGDVTVSYESKGQFDIPLKNRFDCHPSFEKRYSVRASDWDLNFSCRYRVLNRVFQDLSFMDIDGEPLKEFPKDGFALCRHPDGWLYLYAYNQIPTFDEFDVKWDGHQHIVIYRDEGINLIVCRRGYMTSGVHIYLNMVCPELCLQEYLAYLGED